MDQKVKPRLGANYTDTAYIRRQGLGVVLIICKYDVLFNSYAFLFIFI